MSHEAVSQYLNKHFYVITPDAKRVVRAADINGDIRLANYYAATRQHVEDTLAHMPEGLVDTCIGSLHPIATLMFPGHVTGFSPDELRVIEKIPANTTHHSQAYYWNIRKNRKDATPFFRTYDVAIGLRWNFENPNLPVHLIGSHRNMPYSLIHELLHCFFEFHMPEDERDRFLTQFMEAVGRDKAYISKDIRKYIERKEKEPLKIAEEYCCHYFEALRGGDNYFKGTMCFQLKRCPHMRQCIAEHFPDWLPERKVERA